MQLVAVPHDSCSSLTQGSGHDCESRSGPTPRPIYAACLYLLVRGASPCSQTEQPTPRDFNKPSATTAFIAVLFAFIGLSDLTALSLSDALFDEFWGNQAPIRLLFLFLLTGYTYASKDGGLFAPRSYDYAMSAGASLSNSIVFTWAFLELIAYMWVC